MKIHYSPYFDGEKYIDFKSRNNIVFDEIFVGDSGLLSELELRAGISSETLPLSEREANYYSLLKSTLERLDRCFIEESFKVDGHGVAAELLKWRDELVLAGWHPGIRGISKKLDLLAAVESESEKNNIGIRGDSDRWKRLLDYPAVLFDNNYEIIICFPESHLSPWIKKLLDKLRKQGVRCRQQDFRTPGAQLGSNLRTLQENYPKNSSFKLDNAGDTSFRILKFERYSSALEYLAANPEDKDTVYINSDNREFDLYQELLGLPASGSKLKDANPEVVQIFKLGCSLFMRPFNIYNLLSYLQVSIHPLPAKLRKELVKVIIEEGGIINDNWDTAISEYLNEQPAEKSERKKKLKRFLPVNNISDTPTYGEFSEYIKQLRTWANQALIMICNVDREESELVKKQLSSISSYCNAMITILGTETGDHVNSSLLSAIILSVYKPSDYKNTEPLLGSRQIVGSPAAFADSCPGIIWIDTFETNNKAAKYAWLENKEKLGLEENNVNLWNEEEQIESRLMESSIALQRCTGSLTLITAEKHADKNLHPGPFMVQLKAQVENIDDFIIDNPEPGAHYTGIKSISLPHTPVSLNIGKNNKLEKRSRESYSSLDLLIQYPIDYVLRYNAGLKDSGIAHLADEKRTLGNVAHDYVEELVNDTAGNLHEMRNELSENFQERFNLSVMRKGAILLLRENRLLLNRFKLTLQSSLNNLLDIITENQLLVTGCEIEDEMEIENRFTLGAKVDLLLEDKAGNPVIFDLKWTGSKSWYSGLLKENRALQLEIYSKVLSNRKRSSNPFSGYYDIARGRLISTFLLKGKHITHIKKESDEDIYQQCINSYDYRWKQFENGEIEMAENKELDIIPYHVDSDTDNLYPLKPDNTKKKLKSANIFTDYETLKGGLK